MGEAGSPTPLVGRERELESLQSAIASAAGGTPAAVLLTGPPGVGKTRLARELLVTATATGFATFAGRAHEAGRDTAYAPLVAAFGPTLREADEHRRTALVGDLPQLGLLFTGLGLPDPAPLGDPALQRARLIDGLSRLVERLADERPVALLVDDAHLADTATASFVPYLTESVTDSPVLLVLTARPDEPGADRVAALGRALESSLWSSRQLSVRPLPQHDATSLISAVLGAAAEQRLADLVIERCAGRPLFIEAVVRTLRESGRVREVDGRMRLTGEDLPLPDAVRDQLRIRLAGLDSDERRLLNLLAVTDGDVEHPLLATAAGLPRPSALDALERLHGRGLLSAGSTPAFYDLVHGLLRDTLLTELSPAALAQAHQALAAALTAEDSDDARIPSHVLRSGPLAESAADLDQLRRGARHAISVAASEDAARFLTAAVALAEKLDRAESLADLHSELAATRYRLADTTGAVASWTSALAGYRDLKLAPAIARVEQELGRVEWSAGDLAAARAHFDNAATALRGLEPSPAHADLLFTNVVTASRVGDTETVARAARELRELAGRLDAPALTAQAYLAEAVLEYAATDYSAMIRTNLLALAQAQRAGDPMLILRAYDQLSVAAASQLDMPALREHTKQSLTIAAELGAPLLSGWPRARLAVTDLLTGDWDSALGATAELTVLTQRFGERRGSVSGLAGHAWVLTHRGRLADAQSYLEQARAIAQPMLEPDRNVFSIIAISSATLALTQDDPAAAVTHAAQLDDATGGWMPLLGLAVLGEARARSGDIDGANTIVRRLRAVRSADTDAPTALADWLSGLVALASGRLSEASTCLMAAADAFDRLGLPFLRARAQSEAAAALGGTGGAADRRTGGGPASAERGRTQTQRAAELAHAALATFDQLGAPVQAQAARELLRGLGVVPSRGRRRAETGAPLSARELEVARAVAAGMSNAEVATALFVSPRTVTTHLSRIYSRLGLSSRVALTRYLADSGLLDD